MAAQPPKRRTTPTPKLWPLTHSKEPGAPCSVSPLLPPPATQPQAARWAEGCLTRRCLMQPSAAVRCSARLGRPSQPDHCTSFLQADEEKITTEGRSATITCLYERKYMYYTKYCCWGSSRTSCDILGDTENVKLNYKGRLLLSDNRRGVFKVTMRQLAGDDSGTYWCGIDKPYADIMIKVKLMVNKGKSQMMILVSNFIFLQNYLYAFYSSFGFRNWNCNPWSSLRWVVPIILLASLIVICWNTVHDNW
ncbi:uncharacterized protein LOC129330405 [Eublepharis macularius]|uniref:Uncharacterized protein LOC129330405 n=1 Tax=Eublepharis macularius TaxID=481883 RepID=A0AA97JG58_EUBMA|nr:uncharacterized protein LOC129330405 [Eublepharis macularius]